MGKQIRMITLKSLLKENFSADDVMKFFKMYKKDDASTACAILQNQQNVQLDPSRVKNVLSWIKDNQHHLDGSVLKAYDRVLHENIDEVEGIHAQTRYNDRFMSQGLLSDEEKKEVERRYNFIKGISSKYDEAAICLIKLNRQINFHPDQDINVSQNDRKSNGDTIWVVIRQGKITTVMARRSSQGLDYWLDPMRGRVDARNIYYIGNDGTVGLHLKQLNNMNKIGVTSYR